ncbi:TnpV protein [Adlercreutzia equolifaciens]|uniref:TnpV protein n=1 Tax=Adlercreutzia equolifaciens TaxID=446660 RepID=UPI0039F553CA
MIPSLTKGAKMNVEYRKEDEMMMPNLSPAQSQATDLGVFAARRLRFLKEEKPALYTDLLTSGKLDAHLAEIDKSASEMMEALVRRTAKAQGIDESLKREDPVRWAQSMGEIQATADGTVMREVVLT